MLHVVVLLAALCAPAHKTPLFVPREARETVVRPRSTTSDYTLQVPRNGASAWSDRAIVLGESAPHEGRTRCATVAGGERRRKVAQDRTTGFAELRFEVQRR
jgi:hypothetical protein